MDEQGASSKTQMDEKGIQNAEIGSKPLRRETGTLSEHEGKQ